jgi:hypothetical protein
MTKAKFIYLLLLALMLASFLAKAKGGLGTSNGGVFF